MSAVATFVFMMTCAVSLLVGLCVLTYAMHSLQVVVQDTAAGADEVFWPVEPFQDALGGGFHLTAIVLILLALAGVLSRVLREIWLPDAAALRFLLLALPGLWLCFPVAIFSSLSASSRLFMFRPVVVWNLLRLAPFTFVVYLVSAILAALVAALAYVTVVEGWFVVAPLAAFGTATAFLIYGRLLGRLAWKMGQLPGSKRKPKKKARPNANADVTSKAPAQPSEFIEPEVTDSEWETTPYGQKRRRTESYGFSQEPPSSEAAPDEGVTALNVPSAASLIERPASAEPAYFSGSDRIRAKQIAKLRRSPLSGMFTFPWYSQTRSRWWRLSLAFLAVYCAAYVVAAQYLRVSKIW